MHCFIKHIEIDRNNKQTIVSEKEFNAPIVTIGRASSSHIFLADSLISLKHADIRPNTAESYILQALTSSSILVNGKPIQKATVSLGDEIKLGRYTLLIEKPIRNNQNFDLILTITERPVEKRKSTIHWQTSLKDTWLRKRPWAWLLFLGFGLAYGLWPWFSRPLHTTKVNSSGIVVSTLQQESKLPRWLQNIPKPIRAHLPTEAVWNTGKLSSGHQAFEDNCQTCHKMPFQHVKNQACAECHQRTKHHVDDPKWLKTGDLAELRCSACHLEHNGDNGVIRRDQQLCADCHQFPSRTMPGSNMGAASDFGNHHPHFTLSLRTFDENDKAGTVQIRQTTPPDPKTADPKFIKKYKAPTEPTHLIFPHDLHLKSIRGPEKVEKLVCKNCHVLDKSEKYFEPIAMEQSCQRCHRLDFDPNQPERQLPHGDIQNIENMLREYFSAKAIFSISDTPTRDQAQIWRRRVGDESPSLIEPDPEVIQEKSQFVANEVFNYRACGLCHEVRKDSKSPVGWNIRVVNLNQRWFTSFKFNHDSHKQADCTTCHKADISKQSQDVIMPNIATCQSCHAGKNAAGKVGSACADCHGFHIAKEKTLK